MNLAQYEKLDTERSNTSYIRFEKTGDAKYLRFLYESGGEKMGEDVVFRKKYWDDEAKRYVYDTDQGQLVCALNCIEYDADGKNPKMVIWERSAYFCKNTLLPMWRNFPRIIDGVWKVTATNPKTKEATYALFPVANADTIKYPIIESEESMPVVEGKPPFDTDTKEEVKPAAKKKYWE